jgi:anaerobic magnesium-protoporphyrin IX monomethyl ester cyclase
MSSALVTHSYFYKLDSKQWRFKQPYPPLMTLQAASIIRNAGLKISLFDSNLKDSPTEIRTMLLSDTPKYFVLVDDGFNYLTKMCLSIMRESAFTMIGDAKKAGCVVIVNSSDSTDHAEEYLQKGADYVIRGEVDDTLKEILRSLETNGAIDKVAGISYLENGTMKDNAARAILQNLDKLPMPAWDALDIEPYRTIWKKHHGYFSLNIATTRGCPYKCNWCAKPIYGNRYNTRSPEHVVKEIEFLLNKFQPDHFWMCDDIFGLRPGWIKQFATLVNDRLLIFKYKIQSRVDLLLEENTITMLATSGAETVWVGAESGSQKILDAMDKGTTIRQIVLATKLLQAHGIRVGHFLQFGYLGETKEDIDATLKMVLSSMPDEIGISVSYPLPGTKFYEKVKGSLKEKKNWADSDDLAMMFESTYPSRYYKILHRYVHNRYRIQRGINQIKKSFSFSKAGLRNMASMVYNAPQAWVNGRTLNRLSRAT